MKTTSKILAAALVALTGMFLSPARSADPADPAASTAAIKIAAAADLQYALEDLVKEYNTKNPTATVAVTYGSSGKFFAQLQNGAPFDIFLSADIEYPQKLEAAGLTIDKIFPYAVGRVVLWAPKTTPVDVQKLGIKTLLDPAVKKIAIANPEHAPYGRASVAAIKSLGLYDQVQSKFVYGENIAQTAQFAQSGAADVGFVALALAVSPKMSSVGSYWEVPIDAYPRMDQAGVIIKATPHLEAARAFRDFLFSQHGIEVLKKFGFSLPEK
ncbi:MAG: molybdate ABC transporter substrate-binding protein [Chthoniobacteraceae bacterium]